MIYPQENNNNNYFPPIVKEIVLEIELNGKIRFDLLLYTIYNQYNIVYKILKAHIEYINGNNFGNVQLLLKVDQESLSKLENYLKEFKLLSCKIEVLQKREAS